MHQGLAVVSGAPSQPPQLQRLPHQLAHRCPAAVVHLSAPDTSDLHNAHLQLLPKAALLQYTGDLYVILTAAPAQPGALCHGCMQQPLAQQLASEPQLLPPVLATVATLAAWSRTGLQQGCQLLMSLGTLLALELAQQGRSDLMVPAQPDEAAGNTDAAGSSSSTAAAEGTDTAGSDGLAAAEGADAAAGSTSAAAEGADAASSSGSQPTCRAVARESFMTRLGRALRSSAGLQQLASGEGGVQARAALAELLRAVVQQRKTVQEMEAVSRHTVRHGASMALELLAHVLRCDVPSRSSAAAAACDADSLSSAGSATAGMQAALARSYVKHLQLVLPEAREPELGGMHWSTLGSLRVLEAALGATLWGQLPSAAAVADARLELLRLFKDALADSTKVNGWRGWLLGLLPPLAGSGSSRACLGCHA